ncbi:hypothetical protein VKT23_001466 [Stygiomarasmius scandens]|uniref:C2H2-type domain-containing protein n=1 Tax=Marasmiellus scandens TaxID=2682957 RepID=A0ABR1K140_9AGAR
MFSFFSRKSAPTLESQIVPETQTQDSDSLANQQLRTPSPSATSAVSRGNHGNLSPPNKQIPPGPPITPSPPPLDPTRDAELGLISDPTALHTLISSIPPKILHEYTLNHLIPPARSTVPIHPPSSLTLTHLTSFFSSLTPPPKLHCVRCHKFFYEVENDDRSCLVPHDDDSAEVERVGSSKKVDTAYQTLWGCCGKMVEGDGDMGPPDGWCYEGKHTTDTKRARFRADSTIHDDKLSSCDKLKCFEPPVSSVADSDEDIGASPRPRKRKRSVRKRALPAEDGSGAGEDDNEDDADATSVVSGRSKSSTRPKKKPKTLAAAASASTANATAGSPLSDPATPTTPAPVPKPRKKRAKTAHDDKPFKPESTPVDDDVDMDVDDSASAASGSTKKKGGRPKGSKNKPKPPASSIKGTGTSISLPTSPAGKSTSPTREPGASASASTKTHRPSVSFSATTREHPAEASSSSSAQKPRSRKTAKKLEEVVATSVDGEM